MRRPSAFVYVFPILVLAACSSETSSETEKCSAESTYEVVGSVLESRGCTASTCHGADESSAAAGLDLRPETLYEKTVNIASASSTLPLVFPADEERSVLYLKVAAKTIGTSLTEFGVAGGPMPTTDDALTEAELELIRAWIRGGAPRTGVVQDAPDVFGCGPTVDPSPNKIPPLPEPDADKGIQLVSGGWTLPAESEDEVCYVTYYDVSDRVPDDVKIPCPEAYGGPDRECFTYSSMLLAQDPQSHHSIVESYIPPADKPEQWNPKSADWKDWQCLDGEKDGQPCDPTDLGYCGAGSTCATAPLTAIGCTRYRNGPDDLGTIAGFFGQATTRQNVAVAQEATFLEEYPEGVYGVVPTVGFAIWNSHSFNLTKEDTTVSQYINFTYAREEERSFQRRDLTILDDIFAMGTIPPFESSQSCATFTLPVGSRLLTLSSHTHKFGRDFRIWYPPNESCIAGPDCEAPDREPDYRSFTYQDPLYQRFDAKNNLTILDSENDADRTFRYCAVWDNGATNPAEVRKNSDRPDANSCAFGDAVGFIGPCGCSEEDRACLGGPFEGRSCGGDDSACGEGGVCDACPVWGGVTTEEEMFGILGAYYVAR
jgi:hypothetical protein